MLYILLGRWYLGWKIIRRLWSKARVLLHQLSKRFPESHFVILSAFGFLLPCGFLIWIRKLRHFLWHNQIGVGVFVEIVQFEGLNGFSSSSFPCCIIQNPPLLSILNSTRFPWRHNYKPLSWTGKLNWSIKSSTRACNVSTISDEINTWVSSRSWRINFLPRASVSSKWSRNCFIAGSLENVQEKGIERRWKEI